MEICRRSRRYGSSRFWRVLKESSQILKSIRYLIGSKWSRWRTGVIYIKTYHEFLNNCSSDARLHPERKTLVPWRAFHFHGERIWNHSRTASDPDAFVSENLQNKELRVQDPPVPQVVLITSVTTKVGRVNDKHVCRKAAGWSEGSPAPWSGGLWPRPRLWYAVVLHSLADLRKRPVKRIPHKDLQLRTEKNKKNTAPVHY